MCISSTKLNLWLLIELLVCSQLQYRTDELDCLCKNSLRYSRVQKYNWISLLLLAVEKVYSPSEEALMMQQIWEELAKPHSMQSSSTDDRWLTVIFSAEINKMTSEAFRQTKFVGTGAIFGSSSCAMMGKCTLRPHPTSIFCQSDQ